MPHLYLAITAHGYGHLAQVAPVVRALARRAPGLRLTVHSELPEALLRERLPGPLRLRHGATDVGMPMDGPLRVRWAEGLAAYRGFVAETPGRCADLVRVLRADRPDLVLADVPWLPLVAARELGIPAAALSSLNWHDILLGGALADRVDAPLREHLAAAYRAAQLFIQPTPSMPMRWLDNRRAVGPIAAPGRDRAPELRRLLGIAASRPLVLMQFGGIAALPDWLGGPAPAGAHWLVPAGAGKSGPSVTALADLPMPFHDVLASVDLLVTKPGYGSFVEAACLGLPVLYLPREDWPEARYMVEWLRGRVPCAALDPAALARGDLGDRLEQLLAAGRVPPLAPSGVSEAAELLLGLLDDGLH